MSMPFDLVSVKKENDKEGTIRYTIDGGDLRKCPKPSVSVSGTSLAVSVTYDGDEYKHQISGMEIQQATKVNVEKTCVDVTVVKLKPFKIAPLIQA